METPTSLAPRIEELTVGTPLHLHKRCMFRVGPRGGVQENHVVWFVTNIKTWKREPGRYNITLHHGLKGWDHVYTQSDLNELCLDKDCPAMKASNVYVTQQVLSRG